MVGGCAGGGWIWAGGRVGGLRREEVLDACGLRLKPLDAVGGWIGGWLGGVEVNSSAKSGMARATTAWITVGGWGVSQVSG